MEPVPEFYCQAEIDSCSEKKQSNSVSSSILSYSLSIKVGQIDKKVSNHLHRSV